LILADKYEMLGIYSRMSSFCFFFHSFLSPDSSLFSCQDKEEQWMTKLVPGANDFAMLQPLQWNTRYEVEITARNVKGLSEPTFYQFFMPQKPDITGKSLML